MQPIAWLRGLFRADPAKRAADREGREERLRAKLEVEAAKTEAAAHAQQFPHLPPPGI